MSFDVLTTTPASAVQQRDEVRFAYPAGRTADSYNSAGAFLSINSGELTFKQSDEVFSVIYDASSVRLIWNAGPVVPAGKVWTLRAPLTVDAIVSAGKPVDVVKNGRLVSTAGMTRRAITVTNAIASALTDYQVKVTLAYSAPMAADFSDLIFTDSDGITVLSHWVETKTDGVSASIWVKVPTLKASASKKIYVHYGLGVQASAPNGYAVFDFFDDFRSAYLDDTKWTVTSSSASSSSVNSRADFTIMGRVATGGQGLISDGSFHWIGQNNGDGVPGTVYKYAYNLPSGSAATSLMSFSVPPHAASGVIRRDRGTHLWGSGSVNPPEVWEIDQSTGTKLRGWNFTGFDYPGGCMVAYYGPSQVLILTATSGNPYDIKIRLYTLNDDGTYIAGPMWAHAGFGVPQGIVYKDGYVYYLVDNLTGGLGTLYKLKLEADGSITVADKWLNIVAAEREGMSYDGSDWYFTTQLLQVYKLTLGDASGLRIVSTVSPTNPSFITGQQPVTGSGIIGAKVRTKGTYCALFLADATGSSLPFADNSVALGRMGGGTSAIGRTTAAGTKTEATYASVDVTQSHQYEIRWDGAGSKVVFIADGTTLGSPTTNVPTGPLNPVIGGNTTSSTGGFSTSVDYIYLRKYAATEPAVTVGAEI